MADQPTTPSGSRWEPDPDRPAEDVDQPVAQPIDQPLDAAVPYVVPPGTGLDADAEERRARLRGRAVLAGAATALVVGGGLTGFVIGHSTANDDRVGFQPTGFTGQGPGGQVGEGQQGPPSFRGNGDRDRDGDGFGPPQGLDGSSSGSSSSDGTGTSGTGT